jgi:hypothetical protein
MEEEEEEYVPFRPREIEEIAQGEGEEEEEVSIYPKRYKSSASKKRGTKRPRHTPWPQKLNA